VANDSCSIAGHTFRHPPKPLNVWYEPQYVKHTLSDGSLAIYNKGFILKGSMEWGSDGWIDAEDYSAVVDIFNSLTATALFYPRPDTYPTRLFNVQITNDFNFVPHGGDLQTNRQLYQGTIEFESSVGEITSVASEIF